MIFPYLIWIWSYVDYFEIYKSCEILSRDEIFRQNCHQKPIFEYDDVINVVTNAFVYRHDQTPVVCQLMKFSDHISNYAVTSIVTSQLLNTFLYMICILSLHIWCEIEAIHKLNISQLFSKSGDFFSP